MLTTNTVLKSINQQLFGGLIFVEKGLGVHVKCMLNMGKGLNTG